MDPLTAVSLAGTVVQFVDFTSKLISAGGQLYEARELESSKAVTESAQQIQRLATSSIAHLQECNIKLSQRVGSRPGINYTKNDEALLKEICLKCSGEAEILIKRLAKLQVPEDSKHRGWESLEKALISVWSKKDIERMNQRLVEHRVQINSQVLLSLR
jgi:hypothetical protein